MLEFAFEAALLTWEWLFEQVTERFGKLAGMAVFFLPWVMIGLLVWVLVALVN